MTNNTPDLLPCPFCGQSDMLTIDFIAGDDWCVECERCHVTQHAVWPNKYSATMKWNTRANKPAEVDLSELRKSADNAYCRYIDRIDKNCRGADYKLENGKFGKSDLSSHIQAYETLGFHRGICHALKIIKGHLSTGKGGGEPAAPTQIDAGELDAAFPDTCDGKEQDAFEAWAASEKMDMSLHPLHYLFLNPKTAAARDGWRAGIKYCRAHLAKSKGGV